MLFVIVPKIILLNVTSVAEVFTKLLRVMVNPADLETVSDNWLKFEKEGKLLSEKLVAEKPALPEIETERGVLLFTSEFKLPDYSIFPVKICYCIIIYCLVTYHVMNTSNGWIWINHKFKHSVNR